MPIYEYRCTACENEFEWLTLSADATEDIKCSRCKSQKVVKLISAGSIRSNSGATLPSLPGAGCGSNSGFS